MYSLRWTALVLGAFVVWAAVYGVFLFAGWMQPERRPAAGLPDSLAACQQDMRALYPAGAPCGAQECPDGAQNRLHETAQFMCHSYYAAAGSREIGAAERGILIFFGEYADYLRRQRDGHEGREGMLSRYWHTLARASHGPSEEQLQFEACLLRAALKPGVLAGTGGDELHTCHTRLRQALGLPALPRVQ